MKEIRARGRRRGRQLVVGPGLARGRPVPDRHARGGSAEARRRRAARAVREVAADARCARGGPRASAGLGIRRVYVYRPFDGLILDATWPELSVRLPRARGVRRRRRTSARPPQRASTVSTHTTSSPRGARPSRGSARVRERQGRVRAVGRARLQRASRDDGSPRAQPPRGEDLRRDVARGDRGAGRSHHDHELQRVARGDADRGRAQAAAGHLRLVRELRGRVRPRRAEPAERAYLVRTAYWTKTYRVAAAVTRALEAGHELPVSLSERHRRRSSRRARPRRRPEPHRAAPGDRDRRRPSGQPSRPRARAPPALPMARSSSGPSTSRDIVSRRAMPDSSRSSSRGSIRTFESEPMHIEIPRASRRPTGA